MQYKVQHRKLSFQQRLHQAVLAGWYSEKSWVRVLMPLSWVFSLLAQYRRRRLIQGNRWEPVVPIVIVGNLSVGGTGKTPVVASIVRHLESNGYRPGVVSRGFGAKSSEQPLKVTGASDPDKVGDEPVMLARQLSVPVFVHSDRVLAAQTLLKNSDCDVIVCDDGLQHYKLKRHAELLVVDGQRMFGNRLCLPAGPLREPHSRLSTVDQVLVNGQPEEGLGVAFDCFYLEPCSMLPVSVTSPYSTNQEPVKDQPVHAIAGIGNPERFFRTLVSMGYDVIPHRFPDHHRFCERDITFDDDLPVVMTAKDAVKCHSFAGHRHWYLPVRAKVPKSVLNNVLQLIETKGPLRRSEKGHYNRG